MDSPGEPKSQGESGFTCLFLIGNKGHLEIAIF